MIGQPIIVNGKPFTIVGVAPEGFDGTTLGSRPQIYVPITMRRRSRPAFKANQYDRRTSYWIYLFARLKPGVDRGRGKARDQRHLQADHQRRRGEAAAGHERRDDAALSRERGAS